MVYAVWRSSIGKNGMEAVVESKSDQLKHDMERKMYNNLYGELQLNWQDVEDKVLQYLFVEGNAVLLNTDKGWQVRSLFDFRVYYNHMTHEKRYEMIYRGAPVVGMSNLQNGVDLIHVIDPAYSALPVGLSRIDTVYRYLMIDNEATKANINLFANGMINLTILGVETGEGKQGNQWLRSLSSDSTSQKQETNKESLLRRLTNSLTGTRNANKIEIIEDFKSATELGKDNKSMQFVEIIDHIIPKKVAEAWGVTEADMGAGNAMTYNNVETLNYVLNDKVGAKFEKTLARCANKMLSLQLGITITVGGRFYMQYVPTLNPSRHEAVKLY
jgi:hypothetical protein